jgi:hypothetical protein
LSERRADARHLPANDGIRKTLDHGFLAAIGIGQIGGHLARKLRQRLSGQSRTDQLFGNQLSAVAR